MFHLEVACSNFGEVIRSTSSYLCLFSPKFNRVVGRLFFRAVSVVLIGVFLILIFLSSCFPPSDRTPRMRSRLLETKNAPFRSCSGVSCVSFFSHLFDDRFARRDPTCSPFSLSALFHVGAFLPSQRFALSVVPTRIPSSFCAPFPHDQPREPLSPRRHLDSLGTPFGSTTFRVCSFLFF